MKTVELTFILKDEKFKIKNEKLNLLILIIE
jgi:hypothetical protein